MKRLVPLLAFVAALGLSGCATVDRMRRDFVAVRYMQQAQDQLMSLPRQTDEAERALDRALALKPADEELQRRASALYVMARAWEKALPLLQGQEDLSREERILLGQALMNAGQLEEGARLCLEAIEEAEQRFEAGQISRREWARTLNDAGYVLADANVELRRAHDAVRRAAETYPQEAAFVDSLGWALLRLGKRRDAAFYLERARRLSPVEDPELLYHVGVAYSRLGRYRDAGLTLRKAARLDPDREEIREELERLGRILPPPQLAAVSQASRAQSQPITPALSPRPISTGVY